MPKFKKFLILIFGFVLLATAGSVSAAKSSYYDFGPYYSQPQVLGFSFSGLENLPALQIPENLIPPKEGGILPDSPFYFFEKAVENVQLTFTFDPQKKEELRFSIAEERLHEAKTLVDQNKTEAASQAIRDYSETLENLNLSNAGTLLNQIEEKAAANSLLVQSLSFSSSPVAAEVWSIANDASQHILDKVADTKGERPLPENLSTGLQQLKEQGLLSEEESNKIYSLKSRGEVRDELEKLVSSGQFPLSEITKLDEGVARVYTEVYEQYQANLQVAELKSYQSLPQPSKEQVDELNKWKDSNIPPPNNIKPYLWYSRAQDLVKDVDLTNFSPQQQGEVARYYPDVASNSTYSAPVASPAPTASSEEAPSPSPSPSPPPAGGTTVNYLGDVGGPLPGDPTYFIKGWGEGLALTFTFNNADKARLMMEQAERRLVEAQKISGDAKKSALYETALSNYQQTVSRASEIVKGLKDPISAKKLAESLEAQVARHEIVFEKGILPVPAQKPELITDAIKATENAMDVSADTLDKPALPPSLSTRLEDLKAQGLILPEEAQDLTNSNSRQEVREKIRKLTELGTFPPADAKKLDEAEARVSSTDYNQLIEVRKVEELSSLRSVQTDLAQTPTLKSNAEALSQREKSLTESIDISLIKSEDLAGRDDLKVLYDKLAAENPERPVNRGQFGSQPPPPSDAVLTTCPIGATFKSGEGCVWADSGKKLNDYEQYRCDGAGQYYSFAVQKCVPQERGQGFRDDASPVCPAGYSWTWQTQSCQTSVGPQPTPTPRPGDSESCPQGSSYQAPNGCVWDNNGKKVADSTDYNCKNNQYYSFSQFKCVPYPKPGEVSPKDFTPSCNDPNAYWSWSDGKCTLPRPIEGGIKEINIPQPTFVPPGNPFYFVKSWGEGLQRTIAFTPQRREQVSLAQAKERLAEAAYALKKDDKAGVKAAITSYISMMQDIVADIPREGLSEGAKQEIAKNLSDGSIEQNLMLSKLTAWAKEEADEIIKTATSMPILGVDRASDVLGELPIPEDIKAKIEGLPAEMISEENKKKLLESDSRVAVRIELTNLSNVGGLGKDDVAFLNDDFNKVDSGAQVELEELSKLAEIADIADQKQEINDKVGKNEDIVKKLDEFQKTFEPGKEIDPAVRPYVRLTRIDEVAQTVRPDVVNLSDFQNRKDVILAVATLQQEYRPTREAIRQVEDFRRRNPNAALPYDLARIEALSFSLGVRNEAGSCFLPTPPFPANTPCPAPGAAVPIASYYGGYSGYSGYSGGPANFNPPSVDKDGKSYVYGQGPAPTSAGVCQDGYHWMYDSGGWCMSNGGSYGSSYNTSPGGTGSGYTPYSPYYTAPGVPGGTYPGSPYSYGAPSYYGPAPTNYTTNPPSGTVPGSGPRPTAQGQCPSGFHWMSDSGGWCMSNGNTYVPSGYNNSSGGGYNCGSQPYDPVTGRCKDGACPGGSNWDGSKCVTSGYSGGSYGGCGSGYYWNGNSCVRTSSTDTYGSCQSPSGGCGYNSYWDYGSCSCRGSSTYYGGSGPSYSNSCQGISCGGGSYLDYSTCSCRYSGSGGASSCSPPSGGCGSGWWDTGSCSCKQASSQGCYNVSASSCGSGWYWDSAGCTCRQSTPTSSGSTPPPSGSSSGSCPSGYHWMGDNGGWCMSDSGSSSSGSTSTSPSPAPSPSSEPAPAPSSSPAPAPSSEPSPAPSPSS